MVSAAAIYELPASVRVSETCLGRRFATALGQRALTLVTPELTWIEDRPWLGPPTSKVLSESQLTEMAEAHKDGWDKWQAWGSVSGWNSAKRVANEVWLGMVL